MTEIGAIQVGSKKKFIVPPSMMKLAEMMKISEIFSACRKKSSDDTPVYELKEIIEKLSEKLSETQSQIAALEKGKTDTVLVIVNSGGSAEVIINSIELLISTEKPLIITSVCVKSMIDWIQRLIDEKQQTKS